MEPPDAGTATVPDCEADSPVAELQAYLMPVGPETGEDHAKE